jgi:putative DNA primase/helicase
MGRDPNDILREDGPEALRKTVDRNVIVIPFAPHEDPSTEAADAPDGSEEAIALKFASQKDQGLRYIAGLGRWFVWTGSHWQKDDIGEAFDAIRAFTREAASSADGHRARQLASAKTATGVEKLARVDPRLSARIDQWDRNLSILATPAGTIDLKTGRLRKAQPEDYITRCTTVAPDESGQTPAQWLAFLDQITGGDTTIQAYLERFAGYCLTGETSEHVFAFLYGTGRNGKGTFARVISQLMGSYAVNANMEMLTEQKHASHPTELAKLVGARLVTAQETEANRNWAAARIKLITGGDPIDARFMRQDFFTYEPQFKLLLSGNHKPHLRHVDPAMKARLHLVPFAAYFGQGRRNLDKQLIADEGPSILSWMIEGTRLWYADGLQVPNVIRATTDEYFGSQDLLGRWLDEACIIDGTACESSASAYASWTAWTEGQGEPAGSQKSLSMLLVSKGFEAFKLDANTRGFRGFKLRTGGGAR